MDELVTLSPLGLLGYGVPEDSLARAREAFVLDVIAVDAGSMDPGPNYLGRGDSFADEDVAATDRIVVRVEVTPFRDALDAGAAYS